MNTWTVSNNVKWAPCHQIMVFPRVTDGRDSLQMLRQMWFIK